jgi:MFS family permease
VLADRRGPHVPRVRVEVEEQTGALEGLVRDLVEKQLRAALLLSGVVGAVLLGLPLAFWLVPSLGDVEVFGLRLPWLVLGVLAYPFLVVVGLLFTRKAERNEEDFLGMLEE